MKYYYYCIITMSYRYPSGKFGPETILRLTEVKEIKLNSIRAAGVNWTELHDEMIVARNLS
jgi:hypothetical protein